MTPMSKISLEIAAIKRRYDEQMMVDLNIPTDEPATPEDLYLLGARMTEWWDSGNYDRMKQEIAALPG